MYDRLIEHQFNSFSPKLAAKATEGIYKAQSGFIGISWPNLHMPQVARYPLGIRVKMGIGIMNMFGKRVGQGEHAGDCSVNGVQNPSGYKVDENRCGRLDKCRQKLRIDSLPCRSKSSDMHHGFHEIGCLRPILLQVIFVAVFHNVPKK